MQSRPKPAQTTSPRSRLRAFIGGNTVTRTYFPICRRALHKSEIDVCHRNLRQAAPRRAAATTCAALRQRAPSFLLETKCSEAERLSRTRLSAGRRRRASPLDSLSASKKGASMKSTARCVTEKSRAARLRKSGASRRIAKLGNSYPVPVIPGCNRPSPTDFEHQRRSALEAVSDDPRRNHDTPDRYIAIAFEDHISEGGRAESIIVHRSAMITKCYCAIGPASPVIILPWSRYAKRGQA